MASTVWTSLTLLAQEGGAPAGGGGSPWMSFLPFVAIGLLFYWLLIVPQRREQRRRDEMLRAVKPNDHVVTVGGIYGTVTNVHREADQITLKVDENNNTKIRVTQAAIARVLKEEPSSESSK